VAPFNYLFMPYEILVSLGEQSNPTRKGKTKLLLTSSLSFLSQAWGRENSLSLGEKET